MKISIKVGARSSPLSQIQLRELCDALLKYYPKLLFKTVLVESPGDRNQQVSLRSLEKNDFFTRDLDEMVLEKKIDIAVHSAKDLPNPLPRGLVVAAMTPSIDRRDSLVLRQKDRIHSMRSGAMIGTSSARREAGVKRLRADCKFVDLRGQIEHRLQHLEKGTLDGVVVAEAALIRLNLTHLNRIFIPGPFLSLQGKLAAVVSADNLKMRNLLSCLSDN